MDEIIKHALSDNEDTVQVFSSEEFGNIRTVVEDGEPWFVARDVAKALGFKNTSDAIGTHVFGEDKGYRNIYTLGGNQKLAVINKSGVYALIFGSRIEGAVRFKHWVTSDVLNSIEKHGAYMTDSTIQKALESPDFLIQLATKLKEEKEKRAVLEAENKALEQKIETDRPKTIFADAVSVSKTSILVSDLAKILKQNGVDIGQNRLFSWLRDKGWLCKQKGAMYNTPMQKAMDKGLFEVKETVITHADGHTTINKTPKVTGNGQVFFVNLFLGGNA